MAAYCSCCGVEITPKAEACLVCGTPQHGMLPRESFRRLDGAADASEEDVIEGYVRKPVLHEGKEIDG